MSNKTPEDHPSYESILPTTRIGKIAWTLEHIAGFAVLGCLILAPIYLAGSSVYNTYRSLQETRAPNIQQIQKERFTSYPQPVRNPPSRS